MIIKTKLTIILLFLLLAGFLFSFEMLFNKPKIIYAYRDSFNPEIAEVMYSDGKTSFIDSNEIFDDEINWEKECEIPIEDFLNGRTRCD